MLELEEEYISFWPEQKRPQGECKEAFWFIYKGNQLCLRRGVEKLQIPTLEDCSSLKEAIESPLYMGKLKGIDCFCGEVLEDSPTPKNLEWGSLKDERWIEDKALYLVGIKAYQLLGWHKTSKFCGRCGTATLMKKDERAKICPHCGLLQYPRISPAVIVGIKKEDEILLAHNVNFKEGLYSIIAGFVEQGETLEESVKREVYEEVGIKIKNIRYFESKPWSSVDSLMLGFVAEYESGEIKVDGKEIIDAHWYSKQNLPLLPSKLSTARTIIDYLMDL